MSPQEKVSAARGIEHSIVALLINHQLGRPENVEVVGHGSALNDRDGHPATVALLARSPKRPMMGL